MGKDDHSSNALILLDGVVPPSAWSPSIVHTVDLLWNRCNTNDKGILVPLRWFLDSRSSDLDVVRADAVRPVRAHERAYETFPVCVTLLKYNAQHAFPGLDRLILILLTVAVETRSASLGSDQRVEKLAEIIRGALGDPGTPLRSLLEDVGNLPAFVRSVEAKLNGPAGESHRRFKNEWRTWISEATLRWIRGDPERLRDDIEQVSLLQDLDAPILDVGVGSAADGDGASHLRVAASIPAPDPIASAATHYRRAEALALVRQSYSELARLPDQVIPAELIRRLLQSASTTAREALAKGNPDLALDATALLLSAATAIRESQLVRIVWGREASATTQWAIDPALPVMYRHVSLPPHAVEPGEGLSGWLMTRTDVMRWPIPTSVHELLRRLAPNGQMKDGMPVLPGWASNGRTHQRLWETSKQIDPSLGIAPGQLREVMAAHLAARFGPEVAQLLLGDTFMTSAAPSYYCAISEHVAVGAVADVLDGWFQTKVPRVGGEATIGSRLVLRADKAREWPSVLRYEMTQTVRTGNGANVRGWIAHRNRLAAALCAVTGARPGVWIGTLDIDQIVPEYALAIVSDKASDELRGARVVALGRRWLADFRDYLDRLVMMADGVLGVEPAALASEILRSEAPLFSVIRATGGREDFDRATLVATMPEPLRATPNHYRHRLNQYLHKTGIDPELRHGQMGWAVTPAHALADLSPWSAKTFAEQLAPTLDQFMVDDGWYPATQRTHPWTWHGVPERMPKNWTDVAHDHDARQKSEAKLAREKLRQRWDDVTKDVLARLAEVLEGLFPLLTVDIAKKRIDHALDLEGQSAVRMTQAHYELICDRVRLGDKSPEDATEALATRTMLYRMIRRARDHGIVDGPIPGRPFLRGTQDPSPFLPGLGLAIRQLEKIRFCLVAWTKRNPVKFADSVAVAAVVTSSAYRRLDLALGAVTAAGTVTRSAAHPDCVRVSATVDHKAIPMVLSGLPAVTIARRATAGTKCAKPTANKFAANLQHILSAEQKSAGPLGSISTAEFAALCQAAGRLELSGPERAIMLGDVALAAVSVGRCLARDNDWPLQTAVSHHDAAEPDTDPLYDDDAPAGQGTGIPARRDGATLQREYHRLTRLLNPEAFAQLGGGRSDGHRGWREKLKRHLVDLQHEVGECSNVGLLTGFALHRLRFGGLHKRDLAHLTLLGDITRFGAELIAVAGESSLLQWERAEFRDNYLAVLVGKSVAARRQAFDALVVFHRYLMDRFGVCEAPFAELQAFAGERVSTADPGMLTQREVRAALDLLHVDLAAVQAKPDALPDQVRLLKLRILMFLLLEASGARPSSVYGLTLSDLVMIGPSRDYVRIRETGAYGQAKTKTSIGFVPLEGALWAASREWVAQWMADERQAHPTADWWATPLFAYQTGAGRRFRRAHLTGRIDHLLKWASSHAKAHCYWLRKNRVTERIETVERANQPTAHKMYGTLHASGHAGILVPLSNYISDPWVSLNGQIREGRCVARATILAITGLDGAQIDTAWRRAGGADAPNRLEVIMRRLGVEAPHPPAELLTEPPQLPAAKPLLPEAIHRYALARHATPDWHEAILRSGLTIAQADRLDALALSLAAQRGLSPWQVQPLRGKHLAMPVPRRLAGTLPLFDLLHSTPPAWLSGMATVWSEQSHVERVYGEGVIMHLRSPEEQSMGQELALRAGSLLQVINRDDISLLAVAHEESLAQTRVPAVAWVLALVWLYTRLCGTASAP